MAITTTDAILSRLIDHFEPEEVAIISGDPGSVSYPFLAVDPLRYSRSTFNTKRTYEKDEFFQVTVASLDPKESETLGLKAEELFNPFRSIDNPSLVIDDGYEVSRLPGDGRRWNQARAGPDEMTIFYYGFDVRITTGRTY